ncbi:MAG: hydantoinase/oxoprolinase family protein [SAR86 cluster bacterium]|uniref:Hydantoinase/oxoprolinase family protein n=1 Tax=SAR86 cluster bacterium TaxID=2030880 RepID=A0A972VWY9_9GAMM|nr:hydantoinase/oxoprolinase family protein [SAR86 cluster bacterium]
MATAFLGIDTGGTFTDFVLREAATVRVHKVLSTPGAPQDAILTGIKEMGLQARVAAGQVMIIHGTTVATNAALEGKGVRTAYITNKGLKDVLLIGRQTRQQLYQLTPTKPKTPFDEQLMLEVNTRLNAQGKLIEPLTVTDLDNLERQIAILQPESIAINLLFSFLDPEQELQIEARFCDAYFVSRSSLVLPEHREYERGMTTWLNAWIGPLIKSYLVSLSTALAPSNLAIMQSSGLTISAKVAADRAVNLLLSGPAGGLAAALAIGHQIRQPRLMTFDMGGTSTDVALLEGEIRLTNQGKIANYPVAVPMADIHTIGAGGGSIAFVDAGGMLQVGPASAGAHPGPACYGRGGTAPTVTDANLVLGRLRSDAFLGGRMQLDTTAAVRALQPLADQLQISVTDLALGIIRIANESMIQALRIISIQQGHDPRDFQLMSFGGAGGLHICDLADALDVREAIVPLNSGVLSALGMLAAQPGREVVKTHQGILDELDDSALTARLDALLTIAQQELKDEGIVNTQHQYHLDLRYLGQTFSIAVAYRTIAAAIADFHAMHLRLYGHALDKAVELVNLRVHVEAVRQPFRLPPTTQTTTEKNGHSNLIDGDNVCGDVFGDLVGEVDPVPIYQRDMLAATCLLTGPALITEDHTTVFLKSGWRASKDELGNLKLTRSVSVTGDSHT